jgi:hypothetical protein
MFTLWSGVGHCYTDFERISCRWGRLSFAKAVLRM